MRTLTRLGTNWLVVLVLASAFPLYAQLSTSKHVIDTGASGGFWLSAVDVDDDGDKDLLVATLNSGIKWYRNNGGSFSKVNIESNFPDSWSIHGADLDGDEDVDIVACSGGSEDWTGPSEVAWWENNGSENFTKHTVDDESSHPHAVYAADLDDDGDNDIAIAAWHDDQIVWLENNGTGNFTRRVLDSSFSSGHSLHAADMNSDGRVDLLAGGGGKTAWYRNNGGGSFTKNLVASGGAYSVYAADVNGDGTLDIVRGRRDNYDVDWLQGSGFTIRLVEAAWSEAWSAVGADLDGDGDTDIVAPAFAKNGGSVENRISYWLNDGSQSFTEFVLESGITRPKAVDVADFDRDGDLDIALVSRQGQVIWYENTGTGGTPASLTLTSPNGGENLTAGASHNITWNSTGAIANVKLEYSTNNGASYTVIIASTSNDGSHAWTVPDVSTTNALVRVSDASDSDPTDVSNSVFTITTQSTSLTLTSPNGGEVLTSGSQHNITWTSTGAITNVKLEYSTNNGASYTAIIASTSNDGS
ncbi:MAG TPA: VCBS repeat-containing protein, partial [bacterium]